MDMASVIKVSRVAPTEWPGKPLEDRATLLLSDAVLSALLT
jgi:hypothetical protein